MVRRARLTAVAVLLLLGTAAARLSANGGPFLVKYPGGDPAAKGVPAPITPELLPGRESRLQVAREDLRIQLTGRADEPLASVTAAYTIVNKTDEDISLEIGFPILRGIYVAYSGGIMGSPGIARQALRVQLEGTTVASEIVSNDQILADIRKHAFAIVERGLRDDAALATIVARLTAAEGDAAADAARAELESHVRAKRSWNERDAALLADFARVVLVPAKAPPAPKRPARPGGDEEIPEWLTRRGPEEAGGRGRRYHEAITEPTFSGMPGLVSLIGPLKSTQLLSILAGRFDAHDTYSYERLFEAWGGDVRELAVDLGAGKTRPRQNAAPTGTEALYARVSYFDPERVKNPSLRRACQAIIKNLPVTFTFAPMNLIRTWATFPRRSTRVLTFEYSQYTYRDTAEPPSHQLAYVVHPASFWDRFGPIHLEIVVPKDVRLRASVPVRASSGGAGLPPGFARFTGEVKGRTGELLLGVEAASWKRVVEADPARYKLSPPTLRADDLDDY